MKGVSLTVNYLQFLQLLMSWFSFSHQPRYRPEQAAVFKDKDLKKKKKNTKRYLLSTKQQTEARW